MNKMLNVAALNQCTEAEGPGKRFAIWVQGCPLRCPGCCNPHMLEEKTASLYSVDELFAKITRAHDEHSIEGVTFIGGEPFSQASNLKYLAEKVQRSNLSVMIFSGFTLKHITREIAEGNDHYQQLLEHTDILVDGPYQQHLHTSDRRWVGSSNQQIHFLSSRYQNLHASDDGWQNIEENNTIEIVFRDGKISINGFPHPDITAALASLNDK